MFFYLYTFRSLTPAQAAQRILSQKGISAQLQRAPKQLSAYGCGYALRVCSSSGLHALAVLRAANQKPGRLYRFFRNGKYEEVPV